MYNTRNSIFLGGTWFVTIFQLPQRFQVVNGLSPLQAGIRFIPFTVAAPVGSALSSAVAKALKIPLVYLVLLASVIQVVGFALLSTLSASLTITAAQYGYQIIAGFGCGINISLLILMTPFTVEERDKGELYDPLDFSEPRKRLHPCLLSSRCYGGCGPVSGNGRLHLSGHRDFCFERLYSVPPARIVG